MIKISVFRADLNPEKCQSYIDGHRKVLEAFGVSQVTSADLSWRTEPHSFLITVDSSETGETLGGGRIQMTGGHVPLPIETAIDKLDTRIYDYVNEKARFGTGEYCGLWNSKKIAGFGIGSILLMRIGISILDQLHVGSLFAFASPATLKRSISIGYKVIKSLGINGTFYYPKEDLLATALIIEDPLQLAGADPEERETIFSLRSQPVQKITEHGPKGAIEVEYDLRIPPESLPNTIPPAEELSLISASHLKHNKEFLFLRGN